MTIEELRQEMKRIGELIASELDNLVIQSGMSQISFDVEVTKIYGGITRFHIVRVNAEIGNV